MEESTLRRIAEIHSLRKVDCSRLGIEGIEPRKEIFEIVKSLPELYDQWIEHAKPKLASFISKYIRAASIHRYGNMGCIAIKSTKKWTYHLEYSKYIFDKSFRISQNQ